jgi:hypothetical protein
MALARERTTAACWRSLCQRLRREGVAWSAQRIPTVVNLGFLDRSRYFFFNRLTSYGLSFSQVFLLIFPLFSIPRARQAKAVSANRSIAVTLEPALLLLFVISICYKAYTAVL